MRQSLSDIMASGFDAGIGCKKWAPAYMIAVRVMGPMMWDLEDRVSPLARIPHRLG